MRRPPTLKNRCAEEAATRDGSSAQARIYALATPAVAKESGTNGRSAANLAETFEDRAVALLNEAVRRQAVSERKRPSARTRFPRSRSQSSSTSNNDRWRTAKRGGAEQNEPDARSGADAMRRSRAFAFHDARRAAWKLERSWRLCFRPTRLVPST